MFIVVVIFVIFGWPSRVEGCMTSNIRLTGHITSPAKERHRGGRFAWYSATCTLPVKRALQTLAKGNVEIGAAARKGKSRTGYLAPRDT